MNVLFLSTWYPYPPDNGSKQRAYYLLKALAESHMVAALAFCPQSSNRPIVDLAFAARPPVVAVADNPFRHVNAPQWVKYLSMSPLAFRPSPAMQTAVTNESRGMTWDAVVAIQMPVAQYARLVQATAQIVDVDTALSYQMGERYRLQPSWHTRAAAWVSWQKAHRYERRLLRRFDAATVVWEGESGMLRQMMKGYDCAVTVVPNGVDCTHNRLGLLQDRPNTLVFNGSLTYSANYDAMQWFLAEVYPLIQAAVPGVSLTITGSTAGVDLAGLALDASVHLTGFVDDVRLPVAEAAVCVAPIRQGGGTRLKILEAMALGTPVVATIKGAEGLDVAAGEHLLLADTPAAFAQATLTLLADAGLRARLAANARRLVEECYDWATIGRRFVGLVEETVARRRAVGG